MWTEKHFELTDDEMDEIQRKRELKRARRKFSEMLSTEGQAAMKLAKEDTVAMIQKSADPEKVDSGGDGRKNDKQSERRNLKMKKRISFADAYQRTTGFLMEGDITHVESQLLEPSIGGLGGVKRESALDVVEIIDSETDNNGGFDEVAIEETAQRNSVQKCLVWMEVTENETVSTESGKPVQT